MSTQPLGTLAIPKTNRQSNHGTRARSGKIAITVLLLGAVFVGISVATWSKLRAEFESTFRAFAACHIVALDYAGLHGRNGNRIDA